MLGRDPPAGLPPFADPGALALVDRFERAVYGR
jgi:hypothetical protein